MSKVGNYVQRDYHNRFRSQRKSTWSDFNKSWAKRRQSAAQRVDKLRAVAANFSIISTQASQNNTLYVMLNRGRMEHYGGQTATQARVNVLI